MNTPNLDANQRTVGFNRSLELRRARAEIKTFIAQQEAARSAIAFAFTITEAQGMKVLSLLMALPGVGRRTAEHLMDKARLDYGKTVKSCGPKQRERLLALL